jgi:predicted amidohydrolase
VEQSTLIVASAQSASDSGDISENLARHLRFGSVAAEHGVSLLVFPELSLTGYELALARSNAVDPHDSRLDSLRRLAAEARMTVVVGAPTLNDKGDLHIGALALRPDGSVLTYTKTYLGDGEEQFFAPGRGGPMLQVKDRTVAFAICADTTHPQHPASAAALGANVYAAGVLVSEDAYARDTALLRQYSLQHKLTVLMANHAGTTGGWVSAGKSAIWSEDGGLVAASQGTEEALVIARKRGQAWEGMVLAAPMFSASAFLTSR